MFSVFTLSSWRAARDSDTGPAGAVARGFYLGGAILLIAFGLSQWANARYGVKDDNIYFILFGLVLGWCTWRRPWWFWEHPKAARLRGWIGDGATMVFYGSVALVLVALGLFGRPHL